jgi:hypothetical protein
MFHAPELICRTLELGVTRRMILVCPSPRWVGISHESGVLNICRSRPSLDPTDHCWLIEGREVSRDVQPPPRAPTARAMTNSEVINAAVAWMPIRILVRLVSGMVSVGLKALEFVVDR